MSNGHRKSVLSDLETLLKGLDICMSGKVKTSVPCIGIATTREGRKVEYDLTIMYQDIQSFRGSLLPTTTRTRDCYIPQGVLRNFELSIQDALEFFTALKEEKVVIGLSASSTEKPKLTREENLTVIECSGHILPQLTAALPYMHLLNDAFSAGVGSARRPTSKVRS